MIVNYFKGLLGAAPERDVAVGSVEDRSSQTSELDTFM